MILLKREEINKLTNGGCQYMAIDAGQRSWKIGTVHMIKSWTYGKAKAYMRVTEINGSRVLLERVTVFEYLKQVNGDKKEEKRGSGDLG